MVRFVLWSPRYSHCNGRTVCSCLPSGASPGKEAGLEADTARVQVRRKAVVTMLLLVLLLTASPSCSPCCPRSWCWPCCTGQARVRLSLLCTSLRCAALHSAPPESRLSTEHPPRPAARPTQPVTGPAAIATTPCHNPTILSSPRSSWAVRKSKTKILS